MKKVLVTGAAGFIGFNLCKAFLDKGYKVIGIDNLNSFIYSARYKYNRLKTLGFRVDDLEKGNVISIDDMEFHRLDVEDAPAIRALILDGDFDCIVHAASLGSVALADKSPYAYIKATTLGFLNIIDAIRECSTQPFFMYLSDIVATNFAYNGQGYNHNGTRFSIYASGKAMEHCLSASYAKTHDLYIKAFNLCEIYGPYDRPDSYLYSICTDVFNNEDSRQSDEKADLVFIDDVTDFIVKIMESTGRTDGGGVFEQYNICSGKTVSRRNMLKAVHNIIVSLDNDEKIGTSVIEYDKVSHDFEPSEAITDFVAATDFIDGFVNVFKRYIDKS